MEYFVKGLALLLIVIGTVYEFASVKGIFKFKFVLNRMHNAAIGDTLSILAIIIGLVMLNGMNITSIKLVIICLLLWVTSPVSSHLMSNLVIAICGKGIKKECKVIKMSDKETDIKNMKNL